MSCIKTPQNHTMHRQDIQKNLAAKVSIAALLHVYTAIVFIDCSLGNQVV